MWSGCHREKGLPNRGLPSWRPGFQKKEITILAPALDGQARLGKCAGFWGHLGNFRDTAPLVEQPGCFPSPMRGVKYLHQQFHGCHRDSIKGALNIRLKLSLGWFPGSDGIWGGRSQCFEVGFEFSRPSHSSWPLTLSLGESISNSTPIFSPDNST